MSADTEQRKLAAIMFTDMVGYSALSQRDDKLALELLEEHRQLLREVFPRFNGTEIKTIGDAFLIEFNSALEAAQCAIEIQRGLAKRNADAPAERQIEVRIGIHIGDVVHRGGDVYGDGVNIASRIEQLANAGGICVSMDVERQIRNALEARFEKLAPTELKNISVPMDLFRILLPWERLGTPVAKTEAPSKSTSRKLLPIAIALVLLLIIGIGWWWTAQPHRHPASLAAPSTAAVTEKSIAVLPFENLSRDPENAFFTDGVQDQILTDLAKIADLKVISRTSAMQYRTGQPRNLREIGQQLGVAHVVEGSVQRAVNKVRVNAQLVDARTDRHLWAQTYDRDLADVFAIQSEIAKAIADQLQARLSPGEKAAIEQPPTSDLAAFDLYIRAKNLIVKWADKSDLLQAIELLNQAVARDPSFLQAYCELVDAHDLLYFYGLDHTPARLALADAALEAASRIRPDAGDTHVARAQNLYHGYLDYDGALAELEMARRTLPNSPRVFELTGYVKRRQGKLEEAAKNLERAFELDPRNIDMLGQIAVTYGFLRRYPEAAAAYDRALSIKPDDVDAKIERAYVEFDWKADTRPLHQAIDSIRAEHPGEIRGIRIGSWLACALAERDANAAKAVLDALGGNPWGFNPMFFSRSFTEGLIGRMMKDETKARAAFTAARAEQIKIVQTQPEYGPALCMLGLIDAGLGRKEEALREGRQAIELLPVTKNYVDGALMIAYFASIAAWVGEKDLACEQLAKATAYGIPSYGDLKLSPFWDPLRADPCFEKIVASVAPKEASK